MKNFFEQLTDDLFKLLLQYLDAATIERLRLLSRRMNSRITNEKSADIKQNTWLGKLQTTFQDKIGQLTAYRAFRQFPRYRLPADRYVGALKQFIEKDLPRYKEKYGEKTISVLLQSLDKLQFFIENGYFTINDLLLFIDNIREKQQEIEQYDLLAIAKTPANYIKELTDSLNILISENIIDLEQDKNILRQLIQLGLTTGNHLYDFSLAVIELHNNKLLGEQGIITLLDLVRLQTVFKLYEYHGAAGYYSRQPNSIIPNQRFIKVIIRLHSILDKETFANISKNILALCQQATDTKKHAYLIDILENYSITIKELIETNCDYQSILVKQITDALISTGELPRITINLMHLLTIPELASDKALIDKLFAFALTPNNDDIANEIAIQIGSLHHDNLFSVGEINLDFLFDLIQGIHPRDRSAIALIQGAIILYRASLLNKLVTINDLKAFAKDPNNKHTDSTGDMCTALVLASENQLLEFIGPQEIIVLSKKCGNNIRILIEGLIKIKTDRKLTSKHKELILALNEFELIVVANTIRGLASWQSLSEEVLPEFDWLLQSGDQLKQAQYVVEALCKLHHENLFNKLVTPAKFILLCKLPSDDISYAIEIAVAFVEGCKAMAAIGFDTPAMVDTLFALASDELDISTLIKAIVQLNIANLLDENLLEQLLNMAATEDRWRSNNFSKSIITLLPTGIINRELSIQEIIKLTENCDDPEMAFQHRAKKIAKLITIIRQSNLPIYSIKEWIKFAINDTANTKTLIKDCIELNKSGFFKEERLVAFITDEHDPFAKVAPLLKVLLKFTQQILNGKLNIDTFLKLAKKEGKQGLDNFAQAIELAQNAEKAPQLHAIVQIANKEGSEKVLEFVKASIERSAKWEITIQEGPGSSDKTQQDKKFTNR